MDETLLSPQLLEKTSSHLQQQKYSPGLYIVATPIGNIFDITLRAIHILKKSTYILAEDTRQSRKLLNFFEIKTPLMACHEHNEMHNAILSNLKSLGTDGRERNIAGETENSRIFSLICDAGTPLISDPGYRIVNWCLENKIAIYPIPGPCAATAAISCAGLPTNEFVFLGFPPAKRAARRAFFEINLGQPRTMIFFESPHRLLSSLRDMFEIFGNRRCCLCRELTKIFEEFRRGTIAEIIDYFSSIGTNRGEFVLIVDGAANEINRNADGNSHGGAIVLDELLQYLPANSVGGAAKIIAENLHISKRVLYKKILALKKLLDTNTQS
ncbi:MAG: 16S rRNA (cytidine(1402)-2'-O)-methyltransferase [Holosporaceae bacterium]|nr:16S rRNA (cytidine(1402)-2'-O)-methyltransferase [Holosporaceae bacterium]